MCRTMSSRLPSASLLTLKLTKQMPEKGAPLNEDATVLHHAETDWRAQVAD